ncbi:hypothetical protein KEH51_05745 [[Brevibacterium] frigoritolerans]|uniref:Uncharacterized protein n=1 Tax=Peribacillus frigoritolerans TaxID=450367 RepID=A0A941FK86_9BACI|nr:hypothetical protein [Peribacillus frigoritolerans]
MGFVFGAASQFLIQYPSLKKYGIRPIVSFLPHKRQIAQTLFTFLPNHYRRLGDPVE